ncbi:MAG: glutamine amidotransferase [Rhodospirillales bacterium]
MQRYLLIEHSRSPGDDRAARHLTARGAEVTWKRPFAGDELEPLERFRPDGVVIYGGGQCADETDRYPYMADEGRFAAACIEAGVPLLGICLGSQVIAHALGARVGPPEVERHEFGYYEIAPTEAGKAILPEPLFVTQAHFHTWDLPEGAELLASSAAFRNQAFRYGETTYGFQFHPEITIAGLKRWQEAPWAAFGKPGAQSREEQDRLAAAHDAKQDAWFRGFLDRLFVPA